jgi:iron complex outermembrane receptor protein
MNGKRIANTSFSGSAVDINSIPLSAIERVEVLTDGASAVYGTDAIAGVINFIMRKDFSGRRSDRLLRRQRLRRRQGAALQRHRGLGRPRQGQVQRLRHRRLQQDRQPRRLAARISRSTAYIPGQIDKTSGNSIPGNVFLPPVPGRTNGVTTNPTLPTCLRPFSFPTLASPLQCRFDYASVIDIIPPSETLNAYGSARWQINPNMQLFFEAQYGKTESTAKVSPPPVSSATILSGDPVLTIPSSRSTRPRWPPVRPERAAARSVLARPSSSGRGPTRTRSKSSATCSASKAMPGAGTTPSSATGRRASRRPNGWPAGRTGRSCCRS